MQRREIFHSSPITAHFPHMDLSNFQRMDPHLLVGLLNTELRNHCASLDELARKHDVEKDGLLERMTAAGYDYKPEQNQFR